ARVEREPPSRVHFFHSGRAGRAWAPSPKRVSRFLGGGGLRRADRAVARLGDSGCSSSERGHATTLERRTTPAPRLTKAAPVVPVLVPVQPALRSISVDLGRTALNAQMLGRQGEATNRRSSTPPARTVS